MRESLVVANWKMHGSLSFIDEFFSNVKKVNTGKACICPSYPYLGAVKKVSLEVGFLTGAQNISFEEKGAYTGEVSAVMLSDFGCSYVIIGHSERRAMFNDEHDAIVKKINLAQRFGIIPILCVGESQQQRDNGETIEVISSQLESLKGITDPESFVVAYEPVWAIGTGNSASADDANEVHIEIRRWIQNNIGAKAAGSVQILYGGSVKPANAGELFAKSDIDGALVGGASLVAEDFMKICDLMS